MSKFDNLPPLKDIIRYYNLSANKSLGQNFLLDLNLTSKIAKQAGFLRDQLVIEIGPGPGGLTRALLSQGASVIAIEKDQRCIPALEQIQLFYPNKLTIILGDALTIDLKNLLKNGYNQKPKIIANLPYNIGTKLLLNWLTTKEWPPFYSEMVLMFQKEVAERIVAKVGDSAYGRLAILCRWRCDTRICFDISPSSFTPPPKVTSSIVSIKPKNKILLANVKQLNLITELAFNKRRKMLRQSLKSLGNEDWIKNAGIDPKRRAETLSVEEFILLERTLK